MSYWNYRIIYHPASKYKVGEKELDREEYLAIHEVYYNDDGKPDSMTVNEIVVGDDGEDSLASLKWILENQLKALEKPILEYELENNFYREISQEKQNDFSKSIKKEKQADSKNLKTTT